LSGGASLIYIFVILYPQQDPLHFQLVFFQENDALILFSPEIRCFVFILTSTVWLYGVFLVGMRYEPENLPLNFSQQLCHLKLFSVSEEFLAQLVTSTTRTTNSP
jgi:hypothetical protein